MKVEFFIETFVSMAATVALTYAVYYVFRPKITQHDSQLTYKELRAKYYKIDVKSGFVFLFFLFTAIILFGIVCSQINNWIAARDHTSVIYVFITPIAFYLTGILCTIYPTAVLVTLWIKKRVHWGEFLSYYQQTHKLDWVKMEQYLAKPLFIIGLVITSLCFNTYTRLTSEKIHFNPFFGFELTYTYSDIDAIKQFAYVKAPNGEVRKERSYQIQFKDGKIWNSRTNGFDSLTENKKLIFYVAEHSNLSILERDTTSAYE